MSWQARGPAAQSIPGLSFPPDLTDTSQCTLPRPQAPQPQQQDGGEPSPAPAVERPKRLGKRQAKGDAGGEVGAAGGEAQPQPQKASPQQQPHRAPSKRTAAAADDADAAKEGEGDGSESEEEAPAPPKEGGAATGGEKGGAKIIGEACLCPHMGPHMGAHMGETTNERISVLLPRRRQGEGSLGDFELCLPPTLPLPAPPRHSQQKHSPPFPPVMPCRGWVPAVRSPGPHGQGGRIPHGGEGGGRRTQAGGGGGKGGGGRPDLTYGDLS